MQVIPSINFFEEQAVRDVVPKLEVLHRRGVAVVHLDVSDGKFTKADMQLTPAFFDSVIGSMFKFELHLMVQDVAAALKEWSASKNIERIVLHPESEFNVGDVREFCSRAGAELAWSLKLDGNLQNFVDMVELTNATMAEFLAVPIGFSGGAFDPSVFERIKFLKQVHPNLAIYVDGGVNDQTAPIMKQNGVMGLVSGSYLWKSSDVGAAYDTLRSI